MVLATTALCAPTALYAEPDFPRYERKARIAKRVGVLAFRNYALEARHLFRKRGVSLPFDASLETLQRQMEESLAKEKDITLVSALELREKIKERESYLRLMPIASLSFVQGVDHYEDLRLERALENLKHALKLYRDVYHDVVEPYAVAEVELYRALVLSEKRDRELSRVALKRMLALNPWKNFERGYFGADTEQAFVSALVDYQLAGVRDLPLGSVERTDAFLQDNDLDALLFAYAERGTDGNTVLQIAVFQHSPGRITHRTAIALTGAEQDRERVDRWISQTMCCLEWDHPKKLQSPENHRWFFDVGFAESFALTKPTSEFFHDIGFVTNISYQLKPSLDIFANTFVTTTLADSSQDLLKGTTGVRFTFGAGFTFRHRWLRFFVHPGFQLAYIGERTWTHDPDCKYYYGFPNEELDAAPINQVCARSSINSLSTPFRAGIDLTLGLDLFLSRELYLSIKTGATAYLFPFDETDIINFPLHFQLGIGYAL